ncbi:hypothetical protein SAMN05421788_10435 [Filimonas lacunae]|uniref:Uncharacterized protein n=1 Tax=Filimonas lacunae TaxID=477680 RepID=A0A173M9L7_9BACT|nr:hypothetical protein [Filimonas lacunae]BAV04236.1 hypothetical protein FLA_0215 [Filimonas lacunae]SIT13773.1 hypothetical protein SAMN05421788_10435 [Filimonas lacunae]
MLKGVIRLCYRKVIDINASKPWDKLVFADTYQEFLLQAQLYNPDKRYSTFGELITHAPGADKLHFLVSAAVTGYLQQLDSRVPDVMNALGKLFLTFKHYRFEIINSHIQDKTQHQVAVNFYTEPLLWHDTIGNQLLLSVPGNKENGEQLTELFTLPPFVSIYSLQTQ